jgi:hypothetical protein
LELDIYCHVVQLELDVLCCDVQLELDDRLVNMSILDWCDQQCMLYLQSNLPVLDLEFDSF